MGFGSEMKKVLKRILSTRQYYKLAGFYAKFLKSLTSTIIKVLPDLALYIHEGAEVDLERKLDYKRCDILLCLEHIGRVYSCEKEPKTVEWIEHFLKEGDVFYDIGANVGAYSLVACKFFNSRIKIYAFEPAFPTFPLLCKNILLNNCQESIIPLPIALSDKTAVGSFNYHDLIEGSSGHAFGEAIDYKGDGFEPVYGQPMLSFRLDDLIKQFHLPIPNHIKIDVDGTEFNILKGAEKTLQTVNSILMELVEEEEITEFLAHKGLKFFSKCDIDLGVYNYIFQRG